MSMSQLSCSNKGCGTFEVLGYDAVQQTKSLEMDWLSIYGNLCHHTNTLEVAAILVEATNESYLVCVGVKSAFLWVIYV